jgi:hypothetical protein
MQATCTIYPVLHVSDQKQVYENLEIIRKCEADGVFLINHNFSPDRLADLIDKLQGQEAFEGLWTGANFLGLSNQNAIVYAGDLNLNGLWTDNAKICSGEGWEKQALAELQVATSLAPNTLHFGGVAFKYQPAKVSAEEEAEGAVDYVDVITTSGSGTGQAASLQKLSSMREAIGNHPLAVASGVSVDNIESQLPFLDAILIASGISQNWHDLDPDLLKAVIEKRNNFFS